MVDAAHPELSSFLATYLGVVNVTFGVNPHAKEGEKREGALLISLPRSRVLR